MNKSLRTRALSVIPGGVNSPVRAFKSVGGDPLFARSASGAWLITTDGEKRIDFCLSFGPLIHGHAHPALVEAVQEAAVNGTSYAVTTEREIEIAELITAAIPAVEKVRLVNSGTEAVMTAVRLARGVTGRSKVLKFSGCYHGHLDSMLVSAGSGVAGIAASSSAGVSERDASNTIVAPYNDLESVEKLVAEFGDDLALIAVEPVAANMGLVMPAEGFLAGLRDLANRCGALLLFDEVITGFRIGYGAYSSICGVRPDLTCLGKIIGGGLPIGGVGGPTDIMDRLAPEGDVYQAGTLSGNPISVACGLTNLRLLQADGFYEDLEARTTRFAEAIETAARQVDVNLQVPHVASLFSLFFRSSAPANFAEVQESGLEPFVKLFHGLLNRGVYLAPSPFECGFLSAAHNDEVLNRALQAFESTLGELG